MSVNKNSGTTQLVYELAKPLADELGLDLWDIRFEKEGADYFLRVYIDKEGGVTIDDCEALSRPLNTILDEKDPIEQAYVFEVGSPGLGRELRKQEHFEKFLGEEVRIKLFRAIDKKKEFTGILKAYDKKSITLDVDGNDMVVELSGCAYIRVNDDNDLF